MINTYSYENEKWIDIDQGTPEEIRTLMEEYAIHPFVAQELTSLTRKPRIEFHEKYLYCILHFPAWKHSHSEDKNQEVDFIISKDLLITARYDTIDALHKFAKTIEVKEILDKGNSHTSGHFLFISILRELYGSIFDEFEYIEDTIENITKEIFKGNERNMVASISEVTRLLLDFKKSIDLHHDILEALHLHGKEIFGERFSHEIESILLDYLKINSTIRSNLDMLHDLRDTNNSLLTAKQNETVKRLTVLNFVILPLNLIAWIFAMRVDGLPLLNNPNGFIIVAGIMITSIVVTITYVRRNKWF